VLEKLLQTILLALSEFSAIINKYSDFFWKSLMHGSDYNLKMRHPDIKTKLLVTSVITVYKMTCLDVETTYMRNLHDQQNLSNLLGYCQISKKRNNESKTEYRLRRE